ncbi:MAG: conjugative transposon protein TraK [Bacteroidota bacterium]
MFKPTQNIETAFRHIKTFYLLWFLGLFGLTGYNIYSAHESSAKMQDRLYVLAGDKILEVYASNRKDNITVEARDHVAMFHTYFFSLDPDEKAISVNIKKALYMADASAKKQYDDLVETGYIAGIISGNISQQISIDSVSVNVSVEPYLFHCYATIKIIRSTSAVTRSLVTQGCLRNVARSDHNPHGFLIERWETLENKDLKIETR